ncbi:sacsin N-terminal ATP-binding-like domain-containing protein [Paraburkholderia sp. MM5482-R1]
MVKEGARNLQTQLNNALKLLSDDLYSKKSHFVLELVQNADDNHYASGVTPYLTLQVTPSRLVVLNNEVGFTESNVKAICSVGASSKTKQKSGYIGEKGIGFKSVFTVSDAPEIHSNGFHFKFDRTVEGNLLGYVVPHWCEPPADAQRDRTTIILPAAKTYEFGADTLVDLDARLLLFLNKLRQLTLVHNGQRVTYHREDKDELSSLSTTRDSEGGQPLPEVAHYVRAELTFAMKDQFADEKRPAIERSTVVLAFPVDATGAAKPEPASHVFAFLPIRHMGFKFSIQADFILNSSREGVLTDRPWNQLLRTGVAAVFLSAVEIFKKSEPLMFSYLKYIPAEGEVVDPFFRSLRKSIIDKLAGAKCLLSASGDWKKPNELRIAEKSFRTLFSSKLALELFGFDYVDPRMQGGNELLRSLGAKDVSPHDLLNVFRIHGAWLQKQSLEWRAEFFAYIANNQQQLLGAGLLKYPCLPISDGSCVVPAQSNVFFPLGKGKKYGFESELVLVDSQLYEEAQKHSEHIVELFAAMKVRPDEPYDLVNAHILPRHKGDAWKTSNFKALVGHLRYVKDKLKDFLESALAHGKSEAQAYQLLREGIWIGTKNQVDGTWLFARVGALYLSKEYKPRFCIESRLAEAIDVAKLVSPEYLTTKPKDPDAEAESWCHFFARLGVRLAPAVEADGLDWKCSNELQLLLDSPNSGVRKATLECVSMHWANYAGHLTYTFQVGRSIHGPKDTKLALSLRATQAPTKKRTTAPLAESFYPTTELRTLLGESLPYIDAELSEAMLDACRVTHRLDAKALVKRLKQLKAEGGGTARQVQGIYRALDERLWDSDSAHIKQAFNLDGLIQIKGLHKGWFKPSEVAWRSNGTFLDSLYPPIHSLYRDFSKFFIDKLGIPRDLPTSKWVEALTRLGEVANPDERKFEALAIYRRANRDLGPRFGREAQSPDWIETFETEAVYINQRGEVVPNDEYLFANDAPAIAALFENHEDLSFLAIPISEVPRLGRLLDSAEVARLSDSITLEVSNADSGAIDENLTARVRRSVHFFARVLYAKRPEVFEKALDEGRFASLKELEVAQVPQVDMVVSLGEYSRETTTDIALSKGRVLYRTGAKSVKDMLAAELSMFLVGSTDLADTFARILMESEVDSIEDFLRIRSIGTIPSDLLEALDRSAGLTAEEVEVEGADGAPGEQLNGAREATSDEEPAATEVDAESPEAGAEQFKGELVSAPAPASTSSGGAGVRGVGPGSRGTNPSTGTGSSPAPSTASTGPTVVSKTTPSPAGPHAQASQSNGVKPAPSGLPSASANSSPSGAQGRSETDGSLSATSHGESGPQGFASPLLAPSAGSRDTKAGLGGQNQPTNGRFTGRMRRGQSQPPRTKAGRLLSYAAGPGEAGQPNPEDDPAKAAAREATSRAAVEYFMRTQAGRWKSSTEMPHNNPGFDIHAVADDDQEEFIEVKGQSGAWTEEGVALTPTELITAQQKGERYWLCVVEYAQDEKRRQLHLLRNPYGLTQQFRFDVGWKSAVETVATVPLKPEKDMYIDMPGVGRGRIVSVRGKGRFFNMHVILDDGRQVNRPFNPAKMMLSKEPMWQG